MLIKFQILKEEIYISKYARCITIIIIIIIIQLAGCIDNSTKDNSGKIGILVTIVPQIEMVESIGGEHVDITVMIPPGESPHNFEPTPEQLIKVAMATAYFKVGSGVEFEIVYLDTILEQNEKLKVWDCSKEIEILSYDEHYNKDQNNDSNGGHEQVGTDPHIWTSPLNYIKMVKVIYEGLLEIDPDNMQEYEYNYKEYIKKLNNLDSYIKNITAPYKGRSFLVYHPAWGYFADSYILNQVAIEDQGKQPGPAGVAAIIEQAKSENINVIFLSPQFDITSAETIASEIGGKVIFANPLMDDFESSITKLANDMVVGFENN